MLHQARSSYKSYFWASSGCLAPKWDLSVDAYDICIVNKLFVIQIPSTLNCFISLAAHNALFPNFNKKLNKCCTLLSHFNNFNYKTFSVSSESFNHLLDWIHLQHERITNNEYWNNSALFWFLWYSSLLHSIEWVLNYLPEALLL